MENTVRNHIFFKENNNPIPYYGLNYIDDHNQEITQVVNLNTRNLPGIPTIISGKIYTQEKKPVINAKIEIWHADDIGAYHTNGNLCFPVQTTLSGYVLTDHAGNYKIKTIRPGIYGYRARHFYYRISAKGHMTLETTIYFKNDPRIKIDETASIAEDFRHIDFKNNNGCLEGIANIYLPKI
ncbi:hypothetical protein [Aquimarina sp. 2201CG5-10]|uniref:dioxygenase family protein n=1 Tax=Aquimarina callyspongiae TaxID=3098150 RepID=UPI002AB46620|nr:hypothetical protein [Aquimarina sp. 2201CG5-10]MDY8135185.1 hypothetical protein [Aquimarina sp. 2201CG5-10]